MPETFKAGQIIFNEGDESGDVLRILEGKVEIVRSVGRHQILLGTVGAGEFLGEMGAIQGRPRSATAQAASKVRAEVMPRNTFLSHVTRDPDVAQELIMRLSTRLRDVDDRLTEALKGGTGKKPAKPEKSPKLPQIEITAGSAILEERIGSKPIVPKTLPFRVGRPVDDDEYPSIVPPDLAIEDPEPHRLSRSHFELFEDEGGICLRDLHSTLGTSVNDRPIGQHFATDTARLEAGQNVVAAGGRDTPYEFVITVD